MGAYSDNNKTLASLNAFQHVIKIQTPIQSRFYYNE